MTRCKSKISWNLRSGNWFPGGNRLYNFRIVTNEGPIEWRRVCLIGNKLMWNERIWIVCGKLKMLFGTNKLCVMVVWEPTLGCCWTEKLQISRSMRLVAEDVSHWKAVLRMSKREAHENVAYVNWGLAKGITSHIIWKIMLCVYIKDLRAPPEWISWRCVSSMWKWKG